MENQRNLVRTLELGYVVIVVVANIIGSGIYVCSVTQQHNNKARGGQLLDLLLSWQAYRYILL